MLRKANQKRSLDDIVIQKGEFDWRTLFGDNETDAELAIQKALGEFEDVEDSHAAKIAAIEEAVIEGEDQADFADVELPPADSSTKPSTAETPDNPSMAEAVGTEDPDEEEDHSTVGYMLSFMKRDWEFFQHWNIK